MSEIKNELRQKAIDYKKNIANRFMLVEGALLKQRIDGEVLWATRKIDGHLQLLFWDGKTVVMLNSQGQQKAAKLKCLDVAGAQLKKAGVKNAVLAAELYEPREGGRPRCGDVQAALADKKRSEQLSLALFDIVELEGKPFEGDYGEVHAKLTAISSKWGSGELCHTVQMQKAANSDELKDIYTQWVEDEGAEGLVVHSAGTMVWKVKPRHTIDAAVIGYTITDDGVRSMMVAVMDGEGRYQMFGTCGTGISDEERVQYRQRLDTMTVESQYVLSDSRGIAYQMVRPEIVLELSVLELVARGNDDRVKRNPVLRYDAKLGWLMEGITPGVSALGLVIVQERKDKKPTATDVRLSQLTDLCPFEEESAEGTMGKSELLDRQVYKKVSGTKVMLHKFLLWKTNKESSGRWPAYVLFHTDYSNSRKEMIKRDLLYSNDEQQIRALLEAEIAENIKKGWEKV